MKQLKQKILKINSYSILILLFVFSIITFISVYILLNKFYQKEIDIVKNEYISSQKTIIKNQVNNFINFIEHTRKIVIKEKLKDLKNNVDTISKILENIPPHRFPFILKVIKDRNPSFQFGVSDLNANLVYTTANDYFKSKRLKAIENNKFDVLMRTKTKVGVKYCYLHKFVNRFDKKTYIVSSGFYQKDIENQVKAIVLDRINSIKFGAKNNGYLSIAEILNYKGGKGFAKVVALPVKPEWVGKLLDDDKKDAKGKLYRKEYLKIANTTQEGYVSYWFFKKKTKTLRPKLSYVKLYKPYNWLIFTSVYIDDIDSVIHRKEAMIKNEIKAIFIAYTIFSIIFLVMAYFVTKYENKILQKIIDNYENTIQVQKEELEKINKNLEKEIQEKTQRLLDSLLTDPLTTLPNREKLLLDMRKGKCFVAVLNIDSFKEINDFYGVDIGDIVLKKVASILTNVINQNVYKLPADEFAILSQSLESLETRIKDLMYILSNTSIKINDEINLNISFTTGIGDSITKADMALKYAKKHKLKVLIFNEELNILKEYENHIKWRKIIHNAIANDNIIPFVQPIVNVKTKQIEKYECLVRLKDDKIYSPYFFLDIAKHTNQYYDIQKIMVEKCFRKFENLNYKFSINLATFDLVNEGFKEFLLSKIEQYNVSNKLIIELLEDETLLRDDILEFLNELKFKGIKVAIDDFGSGYSNFVYLMKLPVSILKIDGTLVKNIAKDKKDYKLFKTLVTMVKEFDFEVVAEFVEDEDIFNVLRELNVDYAQGYYFSAPFDLEKLK